MVSLTAHEPTSKYINGVEHITFLYSHERLVREYTMCANVESVDVDAIPLVFKAQNTVSDDDDDIYPPIQDCGFLTNFFSLFDRFIQGLM